MLRLKQRNRWQVPGTRRQGSWRSAVLPTLLFTLVSTMIPGRQVTAQPELKAPIVFDWPMMSQPVVKVTPYKMEYSPRLVPLWIEALKSPEGSLQRQAAQAIYRACFYKVPGLEKTVPHLQAAVANRKGIRSTRLAAVTSLVQLEATDSAETFLEVSREGDYELCLLVEPALAQWNHEPVRKLWQERLDPPLRNQGLVLLAIRQLAAVGDTSVAPRLLEIALNENLGIGYRVEAAKALAIIELTPYVEPADTLLKLPGNQLVDRLVAAWLLQPGRETEAAADQERLLDLLAGDEQSTVVRLALRAQVALQPGKVVEQSDRWAASHDPQVRRWVAEALLKTVKTDMDPLRKLITFLNDADREVREAIAAGIKQLCTQDEVRPIMAELLHQELKRDSTFWRAKEQAILLLVGMNYQPMAEQLAVLLNDPEAEVFATAAWGLRKLKAVDQFPAMVRRAIEMTDILEEKLPEDVAAEDVNEQLGQIFQAFGQMKYAEAMPILVRCCRKNGMSFPVRSAAVWAVGMIKTGKSEPELVKLFSERILDEDIFNPEAGIVKQACAIALGRMKSKDAVQLLLDKHNTQENTSRFKWACSWALNQINGHPILEMDSISIAPGTWFLNVVGLEPEDDDEPAETQAP